MHSVNWQRRIRIAVINKRKVVIKENQKFKAFHEFLISFVYLVLSLILLHPSKPLTLGKNMIYNEGFEMRENLRKIGIVTPQLIKIHDYEIIEEYIGMGNLYEYLKKSNNFSPVFEAGVITGRLHKVNLVFIDNKLQNYLLADKSLVVRTDLSFIQKSSSIFSRSIDIATFLSSAFDFNSDIYAKIEEAFFDGYYSVYCQKFPYISIILRNILSMGFFSNLSFIKNMFINSTSRMRV